MNSFAFKLSTFRPVVLTSTATSGAYHIEAVRGRLCIFVCRCVLIRVLYFTTAGHRDL